MSQLWWIQTKKIETLLLVVTMAFGVFSSLTPTVQGASPLADTIKAVVDAVASMPFGGWNKDVASVHFGTIFGKTGASNYEALVNKQDFTDDQVGKVYNGIRNTLWIRRVAELDGITTTTIDSRAKTALELFDFCGHLPITYYSDPRTSPPGDGKKWFSIYDRYLARYYDLAQLWGINTAQWDKTKASQEVLKITTQPSGTEPSGSPCLYYDGRAGAGRVPTGRVRYCDECAETLSFLALCGADASSIWSYLNSNHWRDADEGYYAYAKGNDYYECSVGDFALIIGQYHGKQGHNLIYFDREIQDLETKLLSQGWNSPLWGVPGYIVHSPEMAPNELRLWNTVPAFLALQGYYRVADSSWRQKWIDLLTGTGVAKGLKAWTALISEGTMFKTNGFTERSHSPTAGASAAGAFMLFLSGIIPDTGSLAIPMNEESYQDYLTSTPKSHFGFNYDSRKIRIPVWAGTLKFQFGSSVTSASFPSDGIYEVQFSSDWNTIQESPVKVGSLSSYEYIANPSSSPEDDPYISSLVADFEYSPEKPAANETVTFDASESHSEKGNVTGYEWNFEDGNTTTISEPMTNHTYSHPGKYNVTLKVTDNNTLTNTTAKIITLHYTTDLNRDGTVNILDITIVAMTYGSGPEDQKWNAAADLDKNGTVNILDVTMVAKDYGKTV